MAWQTLRAIVEELDVAEYVDMFSEKFPRFSEAWEGLKWVLARTPALQGTARTVVNGREYRAYVLAGDLLANTPEIWVVFTFNDDSVTIVAVNAVERKVEADAPPSAPEVDSTDG